MPKTGPETVVHKERLNEQARPEDVTAADSKVNADWKANEKEEPSESRSPQDGRANDKREQQSTEEGEAEDDADDDFFDDFFDSAKKAADAKAKKEKEEMAKKEQEEQRRREEHEALEEKRRLEEKAQRKDTQEKGLSAMEKRLQAQKQAAEAKKKIEEEKKKKLAEAKRKDEKQQQGLNSANGEKQAVSLESKSNRMAELLGFRKQTEAAKCQDLVISKEDLPEQALRHLRTCWDENWEHSCAGERREDGSAIFCYPCNAWISMADAFNHRAFELHCEKVGHYGWID